jgi:Cu-processing system permease protein
MRPGIRIALWEWRQQSREKLWFIPFVVTPLLLVGLQVAARAGVQSVNPLSEPGGIETGLAGTAALLLVLGWIGAFMAVPLGADAVAGERERGQLAHTLTFPMPRWEWLCGKGFSLMPGPWIAALFGQTLALVTGVVSYESLPSGMESLFRLAMWDFALVLGLASLSLAYSTRAASARWANQGAGLTGLLLFPLWGALGIFSLEAWLWVWVSLGLAAIPLLLAVFLASRRLKI